MQELEIKTYDFSIQTIGLVKSLEKEFPEIKVNDLKNTSGSVSIKFMDALDAKENEDFSKNLKECLLNAKLSHELLNKMHPLSNSLYEKQRKTLIEDINTIIEKLNSINNKLIY